MRMDLTGRPAITQNFKEKRVQDQPALGDEPDLMSFSTW